MQHPEALAFAQQWTEAWSQKNLAAVLQHFADNVQFTSPLAYELLGVATVVGKAVLADYWKQALARIQTLTFTLEYTVFDPQAQVLTIVYISKTEKRTVRATEIMQFDAEGKVIRAEAMYGAPMAV